MKRIGKILVCLLLVLGLSGCMKYNISMKVDKDGKLSAEMEVLAQESFIKQTGSSNEDWINNIKESIIEKYEDKASSEINFKESSRTIDNEKYVGGVFTLTDKAQDQNVKKEEKDGKEILTLTLPLADITDGDTDIEDLEEFDISQVKSMGIEMNLTIEMPSTAKCNVGTVKDNVVTIDLLDVIYNKQATDIVVTCEMDKGVDMTMVIAAIAGVIVVCGACFVIVKKKKNNNADIE